MLDLHQGQQLEGPDGGKREFGSHYTVDLGPKENGDIIKVEDWLHCLKRVWDSPHE